MDGCGLASKIEGTQIHDSYAYYQQLLLGDAIGSTGGAGNIFFMICTLFCSMDPEAIFCRSSNRTRSSRDTDISGTNCKTCSPNTSTRITNFRALCNRFCSLARAVGDSMHWITGGVAQSLAKASFSIVLGCWLRLRRGNSSSSSVH